MRWGEQPTEPEPEPPVEPTEPPTSEKPPKPKPPPEPEPEPEPEGLVKIAAGTYNGFPKEIKSDKHYRAEGKVVIRPKQGQDDALRVVEKHDVTFEGFLFEDGDRAGCFTADSRRITYLRCEASRNGKQGFLSIDCEGLEYRECKAHYNREGHGVYASESTRGLLLAECDATHNGKSGLQINSEGAGHGAEGVVVEWCRFEFNQQASNGADCNLMGVGTAGSPLRMDEIQIRPSGDKRAMYAGDYAANRECYGRITNLDANGHHVENESPKTLTIERVDEE